MRFFDYFKWHAPTPSKKTPPKVPPRELWSPWWVPTEPLELPALCYRMAYVMLPRLAYHETELTIGNFTSEHVPAGPYFYFKALILNKQENGEQKHALDFHTYFGELTRGRNYYILEYPVPPPLIPGAPINVLAPFFSAILYEKDTKKVLYFVLGQCPIMPAETEQLTTLRCVSRSGNNYNLGRGPKPQIETFVEFLKLNITSLDIDKP